MSKYIKIPLILSLFTMLSSGLLMVSENLTREKIVQQRQKLLLRSLKQLIPAEIHDNDILTSKVKLYEPVLLGHRQPRIAYVGKKQGIISVVAIPVTSRTGYSGDIDLMVGIKVNGKITTVKILEQHETPGLGDLILENKSDWLKQFPEQSLTAKHSKIWMVKKDGGDFDQITGATITPRAVVKAVKKALLYFKFHNSTFNRASDISVTAEEKCT